MSQATLSATHRPTPASVTASDYGGSGQNTYYVTLLVALSAVAATRTPRVTTVAGNNPGANVVVTVSDPSSDWDVDPTLQLSLQDAATATGRLRTATDLVGLD